MTKTQRQRETASQKPWQVEYNPGGKPGRTYKRKEAKLKDGSVPEKVIQKQILDWLKETGLVHWRQNSGTVFAGHRRIFLGDDGLPDIVCIIPPGGRMLGLEVKSVKGRIRPGQIAFRGRLEASGGAYVIVRSLQAAMDAVAKTMGEEQWKRLPSSLTESSDFGPN